MSPHSSLRFLVIWTVVALTAVMMLFYPVVRTFVVVALILAAIVGFVNWVVQFRTTRQGRYEAQSLALQSAIARTTAQTNLAPRPAYRRRIIPDPLVGASTECAIRVRANRRKSVLLFCSYCRRIAHHGADSRLADAIEVLQRSLEGEASPDEIANTLARLQELPEVEMIETMNTAILDRVIPNGMMRISDAERILAEDAIGFLEGSHPACGNLSLISLSVLGQSLVSRSGASPEMVNFAWDRERLAQGALLRDIGGPDELPTLRPEWLTRDVVAIARTMYESQDFTGMPVLSDALEEAGCDSAAILKHCREPGVHVRGCWVVDLVLGKGDSASVGA
jgi:hypothetical protein